ncbi:MAG: hypothetical protein Q9163_003977 [Psora crenata]
MAANEYYNPLGQDSGRRTDGPLSQPDGPQFHHSPNSFPSYSSNPHQQPSSSVPSHQEDYSYRPYEHSQNTGPSSYYTSDEVGRRDHKNKPYYGDDIPLPQHPSERNSDVLRHDHLANDPTIIDRPPPKTGIRIGKRRFFSGKIPWVVYTLTTVQIVVFIAELGKNGIVGPATVERLF